MKRLQRNEMKNLRGGLFAGDDIGGVECKANCYKYVGGSMQTGKCTKNSQVVGGVVLESCDCDLAGATSCAKSPMGID